MREQRMQDDQSSLAHFHRLKVFVRPNNIINGVETSSASLSAQEPRSQSQLMSSRNRPQTAVVDRRVFQCKPEPHHLQRFSVEKCSVLMTSHFATDAWLLEDVHRLQKQRALET